MLWKYEKSTKSLVLLLFFIAYSIFCQMTKKKVNKQMSQSVQSREKNKWIGLTLIG